MFINENGETLQIKTCSNVYSLYLIYLARLKGFVMQHLLYSFCKHAQPISLGVPDTAPSVIRYCFYDEFSESTAMQTVSRRQLVDAVYAQYCQVERQLLSRLSNRTPHQLEQLTLERYRELAIWLTKFSGYNPYLMVPDDYPDTTLVRILGLRYYPSKPLWHHVAIRLNIARQLYKYTKQVGL